MKMIFIISSAEGMRPTMVRPTTPPVMFASRIQMEHQMEKRILVLGKKFKDVIFVM